MSRPFPHLFFAVLLTGVLGAAAPACLARAATGAPATTLPAKAPPAAPADAATTGPLRRVAKITLEGRLLEYPSGFNFSLFNLGPSRRPALTSLIQTLQRAAKSTSLSGVYLNLRSFNLSLTQAQEIGELLEKIRKTGKRVAVYSPDFDTNTYLLASHANTIIMSGHGTFFLPGVELQLLFFKNLLSKLYLQADMVQIGKYKGAQEPLTRTSASPAFAGQVRGLVNSWYAQIVNAIAADRPNMSRHQVEAAINRGIMEGTTAKKLGLVNQLLARQNVNAWLEKHFDGGCVLIRRWSGSTPPPVNLNSPFALFQLLGAPPKHTRATKPAIAVICARGLIMDDSPGASENDSIITPARIHREVNAALHNPLVKAIVLRVDSPGGSAEASEEIWRILHAAGKKKPLTVSMGSEAASGGYYISTAGAQITAEPGTIAGSIGVVGGKIVLGGLFAKIGLNVETFSKGANAGLFDATAPFTPQERAFVTHLMRQTYALFIRRVLESRGKKIAHIQQVARGRLFSGNRACKVGLVDHVGSLAGVLAAAARKAHIAGNYQVLVYPRAKSLAQLIREKFGIQSELPPGLQMLLTGLPRSYRRPATQMFQMVRVLQRDEVLLAAPIGFVEK